MLSRNLLLNCAAGVAVLASVGCKSSTAPSTSDAVFAVDAGTTAEALADGRRLATDRNTSAALNKNYTDGETSAGGSPKFTIATNNQGGVDVTLNGESVSYSSNDVTANQSGWVQNQGTNQHRSVHTWSSVHGGEAAIAGNTFADHHQVWQYFWNTDQDGELRGFAVVGTETRARDLVGKANATYSGYARVELEEKAAASQDRLRVGSNNVSMAADFAAAEISGTIADLWEGDADWEQAGALPGTVTMGTTAISGNSFSGNLAGDAAFNAVVSDFTGTYAGKFFGPNGEEVGGVLSVETTERVGTGLFSAKQD